MGWLGMDDAEWTMLIVNIVLVIAKLAVYVQSLSATLLASLVDSLLDLLTFVVGKVLTSVAAAKYPNDANAMQVADYWAAAVNRWVMVLASIGVGLAQVYSLVVFGVIDEAETTAVVGQIWAITGSAVIGKLACAILYTRKQARQHSESAAGQLTDCWNDVCTNLQALVFAGLSTMYPVLDAVGSIVICVFVIVSWVWKDFREFGENIRDFAAFVGIRRGTQISPASDIEAVMPQKEEGDDRTPTPTPTPTPTSST